VNKPYIGVSGLMSPEETSAVLRVYPDCDRQVMIGVLISSKSMRGVPTRWARRYPKPQEIAGIFSKDSRALNLIHYATGGEEDPVALFGALMAAVNYGGRYCHGVQVNAAWPSPAALRQLRECEPSLRVVLQLGPGAMAAGHFRNDMIRTLRAYDGACTDALIDASGGRGLPLDMALARCVLDAGRIALPDVIFGTAGGLCAETVHEFEPFLREGCSGDAEGKLRTGVIDGGDLDMTKVEPYLVEMVRAVS
jgi:hypothetical protein